MKIRKFRTGDAKEVSALIKKTLMTVNIKDYSKKQILSLCNDYSMKNILKKSDNRLIIVAVHNNKIVGTGRIQDYWISGVFVDCTIHGKGVGTKIMQRLEKYAKKSGLKHVALRSSITAFGFYKKLGYKHIKTIIDKNVGKVYTMKKIIK